LAQRAAEVVMVGSAPETTHRRIATRARRDRIWRWATSSDVALAARYAHGNGRVDDDASVMWGLLCHAVRVSAAADPAPPRAGYSSASPGAWLAPDEVTWWQRVAAALRGETDGVVENDNRPPAPATVEILLRDEVLQVWHSHALRDLGDWRRLRKAVYALAFGAAPRRVQRETGLTRDRLRHARDRAVADMLAAW
jgi:hypothetical protein